MTARRVLLSWALLLAALGVGRAALQIPPAPLGRVSDFAGVLTPSDRERLEERLAQIERTTSNQFVVAVFRSLEGEALEDFSIRLAETWKVGHKGRDNGLILLVFTEDRRIRVEVGRGLEGVVTDAVAARVIRGILAPQFGRGAYAEGFLEAVDALDRASRGEFSALPGRARRPATWGRLAPFAIFILLWLVAARLNRAAHLGGRRYRGGPPWWMGPGGGFGGGMGGFGGGMGGGGFSGGGGSFGGGGASGRW